MKFTENQISVINTLAMYPNSIIMFNGWLTGGHGIKLDLRTVRSLELKGIIKNRKLQQK